MEGFGYPRLQNGAPVGCIKGQKWKVADIRGCSKVWVSCYIYGAPGGIRLYEGQMEKLWGSRL